MYVLKAALASDQEMLTYSQSLLHWLSIMQPSLVAGEILVESHTTMLSVCLA